jgi:hypothetical protein
MCSSRGPGNCVGAVADLHEGAVAAERRDGALDHVADREPSNEVPQRSQSTPRHGGKPAAPARLLPSGDSFLLFQGADRELLLPDAARRQALWTPRVWPGGVLVEGEIVGTWRRAGAAVTVQPWQRLSPAGREAVEREAAGLPLPGVRGPIRVRWED